jgi:AcrR family transcriptional regulator
LTSMADVAAEARLSVGALYRYFASKDLLFQELSRAARVANTELWERIAAQHATDAQIPAFVDTYFAMLGDAKCRPTLALSVRLQAEALDSAAVRRESRAALSQQVEAISGLLRKTSSRKGGDHDAKARALISLLNGAGVQALLFPECDLDAYRKAIAVALDAWRMS